MIFKVNGLDYLIVEVSEDDPNLLLNDTYHFGMCNHKRQIIYLMKDVNLQQKRCVLIHEITHAFISSHGFYANGSFSHEELCEFMAYHGENIVGIANQYYKFRMENNV